MTPSDKKLKPKDYSTDQQVRWCPGCGDYAILNAVKKVLATSGKRKEEVAFISGIGCSSRFPYYVDTYGMHGIHGRAAAIASGLKIHNPNLSVWVVTGDGDGLAIGGNHFIHAIRRNMDFNLLIFNNQIYGLTKGQYSPTSKLGSKTKTSPMGTMEQPFSPARLAIGAGATFFARSSASDTKHLEETLLRANAHKGTSVVEIMQNCLIFNDKVFDDYLAKENRDDHTLKLQHDKPMVFGKESEKVLAMDGGVLSPMKKPAEAFIHDEQNINIAFMLSQVEEIMPLGVFHCVERPNHPDLVAAQIAAAQSRIPKPSMETLMSSGDTWVI